MRKMQLFRCLILFSLCFFGGYMAVAVIPSVIPASYTVTGVEDCPTNCTVPANCTLIIPYGTTARFHGDLEIQGLGVVIVDGGTIRMGEDRRIRIRGLHEPVTPYIGGRLFTSNHALISSIQPNIFYWGGIEAERGGMENDSRGMMLAEKTIIELADFGFTNYDSDDLPDLTSEGGIIAMQCTFRDNRVNHLRIQNAQNIYAVGGTDANETMVTRDVRFTMCTFLYNDYFAYTPSLMVSLINCKPVGFYGCVFRGKDLDFTTTTAIKAVNSGLRVQRYIISPGEPIESPSFKYFRNAINVSNAMEPDRRVFIRNAVISAKNGIYLSGCLNSLIVSNVTESLPDGDHDDFVSLYMKNCTGYRVEANTFKYNVGVVVHQSGTANNMIYRNYIISGVLGIQSIGMNRSVAQPTGLKILCNRMTANTDFHPYDITVMHESSMNDGIHDLQFVEGAGLDPDLSAANRFTQYTGDPGTDANYFLLDGTNLPAQFIYKRFTSIGSEEPIYRNFPNLQTANPNTCPVVNTGALPNPFPFSSFMQQLQVFESQIGQLEAGQGLAAADPEHLSYLLQRHSALIDSVVIPYQDRGYTDSVLLAYQQVTKGGHHYRLMEAAAHASLEQYTDAIGVIDAMSSTYTLSPEEQDQASHLVQMYRVLEWLRLNDNNWVGLPEQDHQLVADFAEDGDLMYAGAIARSLLGRFEGALYEPVYILPGQVAVPQQAQMALSSAEESLYPNPVRDQLQVQLPEAGCRLVLTDALGRRVMDQELPQAYSVIDMQPIHPGIYFAEVYQGSELIIQQKLVKQ